MDTDVQKFIKKQDALTAALLRVKNRLEHYTKNTKGNCDFPDWNDWHDLEYRIEARLRENYSNYLSWHFEKFQFVAISL